MFEKIYADIVDLEVKKIETERHGNIVEQFKHIIEPKQLNKIIKKQMKKELRKLSQSLFVVEINELRSQNAFISNDEKGQYKEFEENFLNPDNMEGFCKRYQVWDYSYKLLIASIYEYITEILKHFQEDLDEIVKTELIHRADKYIVKDIKFLGDLHNLGRCVVRCQVNDDMLIYKPTNGAVYNLYGDILKVVSGNPNYRIMKTVLSENYFWCEYIENESCQNEKEVKQFYKNCGYLLASAYIMNSNDIHNENMIACGQYPMIIDAETFIVADKVEKPKEVGTRIIDSSVFRSNMIPMTYDKREEGIVSCCALGDSIVVVTTNTKLENEFTSNVIEKRVKIEKDDIVTHLPNLEGKIVPVWNYVKDVMDGFHEGYQNIIQKQEEIKQIVRNAKNVKVRVVLRSTMVYVEILKRIRIPDMLVSKEKTSSFLRTILKGNSVDAKILECEIKQLLDGNVPYFMMNIQNNVLSMFNHEYENDSIYRCPVETIEEKFKQLSPEDEKMQLNFIKLAFNYENENFHTFHKETLEELVEDLEPYMQQSMYEEENQKCIFSMQKNWKGEYLYKEVNKGIYEGYLGIILYDEKNAFGKDYYYQVRNDIEDLASWGIINGFASSILFVYGSNLFSQDEKIEEVKNLCKIIKRKMPEELNLNKIDLLEGVCGTILALAHFLEQDNKENSDSIRDIIIQLARLVIPVWKTKKDKVVVGMAHGIAGMKTAMYLAYSISGDEELLSVYEEMQNQDRPQNYKTLNWCNGIVGYYASFYLLSQLKRDKAGYQKKLQEGIDNIMKNTFATNDFCLCHGFLGAVDFLLVLQENGFMTEEQKVEFAQLQTEAIRRLNEMSICISDVSLFTGICGILYIKQRLEGKVKSILTYMY